MFIIPICKLRIIDRMLARIQTGYLGPPWLMGPHSIGILAIEMIVIDGVNDKGHFIEPLLALLGKGRSFYSWNIAF